MGRKKHPYGYEPLTATRAVDLVRRLERERHYIVIGHIGILEAVDDAIKQLSAHIRWSLASSRRRSAR